MDTKKLFLAAGIGLVILIGGWFLAQYLLTSLFTSMYNLLGPVMFWIWIVIIVIVLVALAILAAPAIVAGFGVAAEGVAAGAEIKAAMGGGAQAAPKESKLEGLFAGMLPKKESKPLDPKKIKFAILILVGAFAAYLVLQEKLGINMFSLVIIAGILSFIILKPEFAAGTILFILPIPAFVALAMFGVPPFIVAPAMLLIIFAMFVMLGQRKGTLALLLNILVITLLLLVPNTLFQQGSKPYEMIQAQKTIAKKTWQDIMKVPASLKKGFEQQLAFATEDATAGEIDSNAKNKNLGVSFAKVGTTGKKFTIPEPIEMIATLIGETFKTDQNISINVECGVEGMAIQGEIIPPGPFQFDRKIRQPVDCKIDSEAVGTGRPTITMNATFNFVTSAYKTTYFIDQETNRAYLSQDIDPYDVFNITDKNPATIYTTGPINIGIDVEPQPAPVSSQTEYGPTPTLTLTNVWQGEIQSVDELTLTSPPGISLIDIDGNNIEATCKGCGTQECKCTLGKDLMNRLIKKGSVVAGIKVFRIHTRVTDPTALLGNRQFSIRNFIATVKYTYRIKQQVSDIEVKERPIA